MAATDDTATLNAAPAIAPAGSDGLLAAVTAIGRRLLSAGDLGPAVEAALDQVVALMGVDRATVLLRHPGGDDEPFHRVVWEAVGPGVARQLGSGYTDFPDSIVPVELLSSLLAGRTVVLAIDAGDDSFMASQRALGVRWLGAAPLLVDGAYHGCLSFDCCRDGPPASADQRRAIEAAANGISAALQQQREGARSADERTALVRRQLASERRSTAALRGVIDALAAIDRIDDFVPGVLRVVADAFGARDCALFENVGERVHLLYWFNDGEITPGGAFLHGGPGPDPVFAELARGFVVDVGYLGTTIEERRHAVVIDHVQGTTIPRFDAFAVRNGWDLELNVPIVVSGRSIGALVIYRGRAQGFGCDDVQLAEALAAQLALAMKAVRLAAANRVADLDAAVQRARNAALQAGERAALERAAQLQAANAALGSSVAALSRREDLPHFMAAVLREAVAGCAAASGVVLMHDPAADVLRQLAHLVRGAWIDLDDPSNAIFSQPIPCPSMPTWIAMRETRTVQWIDYQDPGVRARPISRRFHGTHRHRFVAHLPLLLDDVVIGMFGLAWDESVAEQPSPSRFELARVLAQQAALAVRIAQLAEQAQVAAVASAREAQARRHAEEMRSTNEALQAAIAGLARIDDLDAFLAEMVAALVRSSRACGGAVSLAGPDGVAIAVLFDAHGRVGRERQAELGLLALPWDAGLRALAARLAAVAATGTVDADDGPGAPLADAEPLLAFHRRDGARVMHRVAMRSGERVIGWVSLAFRDPPPEPAEPMAMQRLLADQMTVAVELRRLAEERQAAALAMAREAAALDHARGLEQANRELRQHDRLLRALAEAAALQLADPAGAASLQRALQLLAEAGRFQRLVLACHADRGAPGDGWNQVQQWCAAGVAAEAAHFAPCRAGAGVAAGQDGGSADGPRQAVLGDGTPPTRDTVAARLAACSVQVPIQVGGAPWGSLLLDDLAVARPRGAGELAVLCTAAQVLGLAIEQRELRTAKEALEREVALAHEHAVQERAARATEQAQRSRERELAAQLRAQDLARANAALRAVNDRLGYDGDPKSVLREVLAETVRALGADIGGVFEYQPAARALFLHCVTRASGPLTELPGHPFGQPGMPWPVDALRSWQRMTHSPGPVVQVLLDADPASLTDVQRWHLAQGHSLAVHIALMVAGEPLGVLGLSSAIARRWVPTTPRC